MSDLRHDPVFDVWTVIAERRGERPIEFLPHPEVRRQLICPFCAGNEEETPPERLALDGDGNPVRSAADRNWTARVFANRYPTFGTGKVGGAEAAGPYQRADGSGLQELVIPTPRHVDSLSGLTEAELLAGFLAAQQRIGWMHKEGCRHAVLFGNCRYEAGASIEHVHFQVIGSSLVSPAMLRRVERMRQHRTATGESLVRSIGRFEESAEIRMVARTEHWLMFCPFASRAPFQVWIVPAGGAVRWQDFGREELAGLGSLSREYVRCLETLTTQPGYNWVLHQLPFEEGDLDHCFVEIVPRLAKAAGFELGSDIQVNPVSPETAARRLRRQLQG